MNKRQIVLTVVVSSIFTLTIIGGVMSFLSQALAAPLLERESSIRYQNTGGSLQFVSISALAFQPAQPSAAYSKDAQRQILSLTGQNRNFIANNNFFVAPLILPDGAELLGLTLFGEDFDNQGEIRLRLKRCDHSQARCIILAETTSTTTFAAGQFETTRISIPSEIVDNRFFTYFWELELTALLNSGLRSVRLEIVTHQTTPPSLEQWSLAGDVTSFSLPNSHLTQARICADDLSHLPNSTHYPFAVVDNRVTPLSSDACVTVWGQDIKIQRKLNTGPSSGTYQFLR